MVERWAPALVLMVVSVLMSGWLVARPQATGMIAAVFPPWWSVGQVFAATAEAGPVLRQGAWPWIVVVAGPTDQTGPALRAAGALLLVDPAAAGICGTDRAVFTEGSSNAQ